MQRKVFLALLLVSLVFASAGFSIAQEAEAGTEVSAVQVDDFESEDGVFEVETELSIDLAPGEAINEEVEDLMIDAPVVSPDVLIEAPSNDLAVKQEQGGRSSNNDNDAEIIVEDSAEEIVEEFIFTGTVQVYFAGELKETEVFEDGVIVQELVPLAVVSPVVVDITSPSDGASLAGPSRTVDFLFRVDSVNPVLCHLEVGGQNIPFSGQLIRSVNGFHLSAGDASNPDNVISATLSTGTYDALIICDSISTTSAVTLGASSGSDNVAFTINSGTTDEIVDLGQPGTNSVQELAGVTSLSNTPEDTGSGDGPAIETPFLSRITGAIINSDGRLTGFGGALAFIIILAITLLIAYARRN